MKDHIKKVAIFQPLVPLYRVPFFEKLGESSNCEVDIYSGNSIGSLEAISSAKYYKQIYSPVRFFKLAGMELKIQLKHITLKVRRYDVVVASWDSRYLTLLFIILKCKINRVPIVLWGHGYSKSTSVLKDKIREYYGRFADGLIFYSSAVANDLIENGVYPARKVFVAQNAIDHEEILNAISYWSNNKIGLDEFKRKNFIEESKLVIFVSRLEADNKIEMLFPVLAKVREKHNSCKLIVVGNGSYANTLRDKAIQYGVDQEVIFVGPIYDQMELAPWMLSSAFFCYPVNIGLSIHHAFSYGLPVVTSDDRSKQNPEIELLCNKENGLTYIDGSEKDMVRAWDELLSDETKRNRMSESAKSTVYDNYTIEIMCKGFRQAIDCVCAND